jgi:hypothetical protein
MRLKKISQFYCFLSRLISNDTEVLLYCAITVRTLYDTVGINGFNILIFSQHSHGPGPIFMCTPTHNVHHECTSVHYGLQNKN